MRGDGRSRVASTLERDAPSVREAILVGCPTLQHARVGVGRQRVLAALFHVAYIVAHRIRGYDTLVMEVNPRHVRYYERMLGARAIGEPRWLSVAAP